MIRIPHSGPRLRMPLHEDLKGNAIYGLGMLMQVGPTTGALMVNLRVVGAKAIDMEAGTDVILFDRVQDIRAERAVALDRNEPARHPVTGEELTMAKYPPVGGFVPLGATLADGTPHPHAGTGFGLGQAIGFPTKRHVVQPFDMHDVAVFFDVMQFRYDGKRFYIESAERFSADQVIPGWVLKNRPFRPGVLDREEIITGMVGGRPGQTHGVGVTRWSRVSGKWRPMGFAPVTPADSSFEPSMIRDVDGSLLLSVRGWGVEGVLEAERNKIDRATINRFQVYRSKDAGTTWEQTICLDNMRPWSPVCINQLADGTPFLAANRKVAPRDNVRGNTTPDARMREFLCAWKLTKDRRGVEPESLLLDAPALFGPVPSGLVWYLDHPIGGLLRLADGKQHALLTFRVADAAEVVSDHRPTDVTGLWAEEVIDS